MVYLELLVVLLLTLFNGALAMSELALVSARRGRLQQLANEGNRGAYAALGLMADQGRLLSTVQIGITLVGILAGAFGGATLADRLGDWLDGFTWIAPNGDNVAIPLVVLAITYLSLIVGELVPKRIALNDPERVACLVARPMGRLSRVAAPAAWVLKKSSDRVLRLLRLERKEDSSVTEEEVKALIAEGTTAGVFHPEERQMIEGVLRLADRSVGQVMTPRPEIVWLDRGADQATVRRVVAGNRHSRLVVGEGSVDRAVGVVHTKDLLGPALAGEPLDLPGLMQPPLIVPETTTALHLLEQFRATGVHLAIVVDEYGTTEGVVSMTDLLESIAGQLPESGDAGETPIVRRADGSLLVEGALPLDEFEAAIGVAGLNAETAFHTVAGLVLKHLGRVPRAGDLFEHRGFRYEVLDMDGRRIDKVLVTPLHPR
jgi:putative hemolysin